MDQLPAPQAPALQTADQERTERHLRNLSEMAAIGMTLVRVAQEQILQQIHEPKSVPAHPLLGHDLGLAVIRLARMIRQTMALEHYFATPQPRCLLTTTALTGSASIVGPNDPSDKPDPADKPEPSEQPERAELTRAGAPRERLLDDLNEHLTIPDIAKLLAERPLAAIVAELCQTLGVEPAECGWTPDLLAEPLPSPDPTSSTPSRPPTPPAGAAPPQPHPRPHQSLRCHDPPH